MEVVSVIFFFDVNKGPFKMESIIQLHVVQYAEDAENIYENINIQQ